MAIVHDDIQNAENLPKNEFSVLPAGRYAVTIVASSAEITKSGTGEYYKLTLEVVGPDHAGRKIFWNINIINPNATAQNIGRAQWRELLEACGATRITDTEQLHGILFDVAVKIKADATYGDKNEIKNAYPHDPSKLVTTPTQSVQPPASAVAPPPAVPPPTAVVQPPPPVPGV